MPSSPTSSEKKCQGKLIVALLPNTKTTKRLKITRNPKGLSGSLCVEVLVIWPSIGKRCFQKLDKSPIRLTSFLRSNFCGMVPQDIH